MLVDERTLLSASLSLAAGDDTSQELRSLIERGEDPLGDAFCRIRSAETRRDMGATYTPVPIVRAMVDWAKARATPRRIVDPGVGSARFLVEAGKRFPDAQLIGIDIDPTAAAMARANLAVHGMADRSTVLEGDFRDYEEACRGQTLYIGNPPYVRHHQIDPDWKAWFAAKATELGVPASKLAGLHVHFFVATALKAKPSDLGVFITAAEWLDTNYGASVRSLVAGKLGGTSVTVIDPKARPFPDAATTAAITTFAPGTKTKTVSFKRADSVDDLELTTAGRRVARDRLQSEARWSHLSFNAEKPPEGFVELGELCRVHRGTVTGANDVWIAGAHSAGLPASVLFPSVTKARDVLEAEGEIACAARLRSVIDIPADLDELDKPERTQVQRFLKVARKMGAHRGYVAEHRKAWWAVGLRKAAPIISTYMARRAPGFALNTADARHINVAHGLYPRDEMSDDLRRSLVVYLQANISQSSGRTYAGGLTKFEPREMERLLVPSPALLEQGFNA